MSDFTVLLEGLVFPEGPRWHQDRLWFSDMHGHKVMAVDIAGQAETIVEVPNQPSGLGWTSDGKLLIVSMTDRRLLRLDEGTLTQVADLSGLASWHCNDMVVDGKGRTYIGNFGFDIYAEGAEPCTSNLIRVDPDGTTSIAAPDMQFPNGTVITPDGKTMILGETWGGCLTAFDIESDGTLTNRRIWAGLEGAVPDGITMDAEGGIWLANPIGANLIRVIEGGEVTNRLSVSTNAFACMLGGPDGKTLFALTSAESNPELLNGTTPGKIEMAQVDVPHAGRP